MQYAIVDIETTGGYAAANGITEIAVFISTGKRIIKKFHTLLNPVYTIPKYISALTGITNEMVETERPFSAIAGELYELLHDKIFVAHNVNFDYSFVKYHLSQCGYDLDCKKLCTVRLSRKVVPDSPGYGLGKICSHLGIQIEDRHRAAGDAHATARLLHYLLRADTNGHAQTMIKGRNKEQFLPPNIPAQAVRQLPHQPGVYYFHDKKGKVIYVGKAKSLARRVNSHFSNNKPNKQKQEFLKKIYDISYKETGTELMAFILESIEIKKLWPEQNRSQKRFEQSYGLYCFEDRRGYLRLCIEKKKKNIQPLYTFNLLTEGHNRLRRLVQEFQLCPRLCFLQRENAACHCSVCEEKETSRQYNKKVEACMAYLNKELPSFALMDEGLKNNEQSCILMEKGRFYGMGYLPADISIVTIEECKNHLTPYAENDYIRGLVYQHATRYPDKKIILSN
ncbi:MAG TPA: exonuclease domain-containing protein [Chitinophagaceae bacterium]|nr:exonuclease domain-containing protein [Chitinophagaceae bacterium]